MKKIKYWLLLALTPVQKLLQRIGKQESMMNEVKVKEIMRLADQGDILLSYEHGRPTSFLIKGFYDHAAIITSKLTVMEAVGDKVINGKNVGGVREVDLEEWLYKKDHVAVIRPVYLDVFSYGGRSNIINRQAAAAALYFKGKAYDYGFNVDNEKVYCSELVYLSYVNFDTKFMRHIEGEILPEDYYKMCFDLKDGALFELLYDSRKPCD